MTNGCLLISLLTVLLPWVHGLGASRREARASWGREPEAERAEAQVAGFAAVVEDLRQRVDPWGAYLVAAAPYGDGAVTVIALRLALLPRRPILVGRFLEIPGSPTLQPEATVFIENDVTPPSVRPALELPASDASSNRGLRDDSIPCAVDEVTVARTREIGIRGWCQEKGGTPCDVVAVLVRGLPVPFVEIDRHPRPDVAAVLSGFRPSPRAGYRVRVPAESAADGPVEVQVVFRTADGRTRTYERVSGREVP
ncbi:MAG TPA: hypothetical protein VE129_04560 [Thermoanaerobaculia bacterium]|nr:hypothetical protein [Thermoanaerobaculia bacterium]